MNSTTFAGARGMQVPIKGRLFAFNHFAGLGPIINIEITRTPVEHLNVEAQTTRFRALFKLALRGVRPLDFDKGRRFG